MDIRVSGHKVEIGNAFKELATTRVQDMADKHFSRAVAASVTLEPGPHDRGFNCDILIPLNGIVLKGTGRSPEARQAFDQAADKIEKQLRRYSRRLKDRHGPGPDRGAGAREQSFEFNAGYTVFQGPGEEESADESADSPMVIAETKVDVPEASVSDAVMMLDLRNTTALLFKNSKTGRHNMVYRRDDGNIGWVEPRD
jgi:ribosomal subunit interface protein